MARALEKVRGDYLTKPFNKTHVLAYIAPLLRWPLPLEAPQLTQAASAPTKPGANAKDVLF